MEPIVIIGVSSCISFEKVKIGEIGWRLDSREKANLYVYDRAIFLLIVIGNLVTNAFVTDRILH